MHGTLSPGLCTCLKSKIRLSPESLHLKWVGADKEVAIGVGVINARTLLVGVGSTNHRLGMTLV